eukprot:CAMPEP_0198722272 /NCGR_PEP_ID=MMETSP1475-20131203/57_1 /TAXON_ID= ORGANISM="Unidentified sp., Strain CCMP1999" /NCGR_SAMPLE_ID=MMETSP1475 /ASSEMBLY_ACC=CAM_ASM_001111 /LENGTH=76 /DNA_ID=CAMNT_0044483171 /DNA_START=465 /DNA_END=695 /DNA_ORIENTATION=+
MGAIIRHGPHHSAKKSTTTRWSPLIASLNASVPEIFTTPISAPLSPLSSAPCLAHLPKQTSRSAWTVPLLPAMCGH